jgi:hypothetical protein
MKIDGTKHKEKEIVGQEGGETNARRDCGESAGEGPLKAYGDSFMSCHRT